MSRLGDIETSIITRLATATIDGGPAFSTIEGASGGNRPALRAAMLRGRTPAAYVAFLDESLAPEVRTGVRGSRFAVLISDRTLRAASDPRQGDEGAPGTFALLDAAKLVLDSYSPAAGLRLVCVHEKFVDADERFGVYELLYRVWPIDEIAPTSLTFGGSAIAGTHSEMKIEIGSFRVVLDDSKDPPVYVVTSRPVFWRGEIRGTSHSQLWSIEDGIEDLVAARAVEAIAGVHGRDLDGCLIERYEREGPRRIVGTQVVQSASVHFVQLTPVA